MSTQSITGTLKEATGMSIGMAVIMIVLGFLAVFLPFATGIGISILVGWIIVFSGFAYLAYAFAAQGAGAFLWRTLVGVAYVIGGLYLAFHPGTRLGVSHSGGGGDFPGRRRAGTCCVFPVSCIAGFRMDSL